MAIQDPTEEQFPLVDFSTWHVKKTFNDDLYRAEISAETDRIAESPEELQKLIPYAEMLELMKVPDGDHRIRAKCRQHAQNMVSLGYVKELAVQNQAYEQLSMATAMREAYLLRGIPEEFASVMRTLSWERSHSYGQHEVFLTLKEMADEFRPVINNFTNNRSVRLILEKERSTKDGKLLNDEETDWSIRVEIKGVVCIEQIYKGITRVYFIDKEHTDADFLRTGWDKWDDNCLEIGFREDHVKILGENDDYPRYFTDWHIETKA